MQDIGLSVESIAWTTYGFLSGDWGCWRMLWFMAVLAVQVIMETRKEAVCLEVFWYATGQVGR